MFKSFVTGPMLVLSSAGILFASVAAASAGQKIRVYDIPKEQPQGGMMSSHGGAAGPHAGNATGMPTLKCAKLPEGWKEDPEPGQMRAASFRVTEGDNEGDVGAYPIGDVPNVEFQMLNIWRSQLKLPQASETEVTSKFTKVPIGDDGSGKLYDFVSTEPVLGDKYKARILVAYLKRPEANWFIKFSGEDAFVVSQRDAFLEFLKGLSFEAPQMPSQPPMAGGGMMGMMGGDTVKAGTGEHPAWQVPPSWTEVDHSPFLVAKFHVTGEQGATADINVSSSGGSGGGLLPNVNRWRGQLSLGPLDQAGLEKVCTSLDLSSGKATLVDMSGSGSEDGDSVRCVAVLVQLPSSTWIYKLAGPEELVARERKAFLEFVRSVKY